MLLGVVLVVLGGVLAAILGGAGSIIGIGRAAQAGAALLSEEPEKFGGQGLVLTALAGTQGIYGFLIGIMVLQKIGLLTGNIKNVGPGADWQLFFACLSAGLLFLFSAMKQGTICAAGIQVLAKKPSEVGKSIILAALVETYAVLGLLIGVLLINGIPVG